MRNLEFFEHPSDYNLGADYDAGIYYWACMPGCLPDSDPVGPFATLDDAHADAARLDDDAPSDGDIILSPSGPLGGRTSVAIVGGKFLGEFPTDDAAHEFVREHMRRTNWFPTVWFQSDHGNLSVVSI